MQKDELIKQQIMDYISGDRRMDPSGIIVTVENGIATISGTVSTYHSYRSLANYAHMNSGARAVKFDIEVKYARPQPRDVEIATFIQDSFEWDADLNGSDIKVTVKDGYVRVFGNINAFWKKQLAEKHIAKIVGVKNIKNELGIVHSDKISDKELSRVIVRAMKTNENIDVTTVNMNVMDATVNMTGTARSYLESEEIYRTALFTPGVKHIENSIQIVK